MRFLIPFGNWRVLIAVLMLLGNYLDSLPLLHHHQQEHACLEQNGSYFFLVADPAQPSSAPLRLTPIRIGEHHEHRLCGLCQLLPSLLDGQLLPVSYPATAALFVSFVDVGAVACHPGPYRPRGPPLFS